MGWCSGGIGRVWREIAVTSAGSWAKCAVKHVTRISISGLGQPPSSAGTAGAALDFSYPPHERHHATRQFAQGSLPAMAYAPATHPAQAGSTRRARPHSAISRNGIGGVRRNGSSVSSPQDGTPAKPGFRRSRKCAQTILKKYLFETRSCPLCGLRLCANHHSGTLKVCLWIGEGPY
jgi:hypothetical protein